MSRNLDIYTLCNPSTPQKNQIFETIWRRRSTQQRRKSLFISQDTHVAVEGPVLPPKRCISIAPAFKQQKQAKKNALAGNRTPVTTMARLYDTTTPLVHRIRCIRCRRHFDDASLWWLRHFDNFVTFMISTSTTILLTEEAQSKLLKLKLLLITMVKHTRPEYAQYFLSQTHTHNNHSIKKWN